MFAPIHPQQEQRLETLGRYDILDTPQEADFDDIVELASKICETPISLISLVDDTRQWFKAKVGLGATETPLESSICSHAILEDAFVEIPDVLADQRTADNPLAHDETAMRFYAGAKLVAPNGMPIGTLCVIDTKPRHLTDLQRDALRILSKQVMKQIELRFALQNQTILQAEMDHRVKNSLQSISSVVRIYSRTVEDENAQDALSAVQRRIDAVATLHSELQTGETPDLVNTRAYMHRVIELLQAGAPENVSITPNIGSVLVSSKTATNLAMITSEFVANSIKHGFPDDRAGQISIEFRDLGDNHFRLECHDDGIGSLSNTDETPTQAQGIGMRVMAAAASGLGGTTQTDLTHDGSQLILEFSFSTTNN